MLRKEKSEYKILINLKIRRVIYRMDRKVNCTQCRVVKPLSEFLGRNNKILKTCNGCRERSNRSREKHKEVSLARNREWKEKNKDRTKEYNKAKREGKDWSEIKKEKGIVDQKSTARRKPHIFINGVEYKNCSKCKKDRPLQEYTNYTNSWDGLRPTCNSCLQEYRENNKEQKTEYNKDYWQKTKVEQTANHKVWKQNNREHVNQYMRNYMPEWEKKQREINPQFKIRKNLRTRLWHALRDQNVEKRFKTFDLVGCSIEFLCERLESKFKSGMTWENYGEWHVDHIKPCASFDLTNEDEQRECFHYTNLQPLWGAENISKGCKILPNEIEMEEDEMYMEMEEEEMYMEMEDIEEENSYKDCLEIEISENDYNEEEITWYVICIEESDHLVCDTYRRKK